QLTFKSGQKQLALPAAELVRWGACVEPDGATIVVAADGGLLVADVLRSEKERLKVDSGLFGVVEVPLERLAGVVFRLPGGRRGRDRLLDRLVRAAGDSDRLLLRNGDELTGLVEAVEDDTVRLAADDGPLEIETRRIAALVFNPLLKRAAGGQGLRSWVGLADGSRLLATRLVADGSSLEVTTAGGQTWKTSPKELVAVQPLGGRVTYLSDLKPAEYVQVPYLKLRWPNFGTDRNVTGGRLRCGGRLYLKGLGVHSAARLTYRLDKPYKRFQAELGIDDSTGGGSVRFRVFVDGREKYTGESILRGGTPPLSVSVELDGAKRLDLVVDYADRADELDHADWLDARLVR
ncbi:MAG: NPCBM/NEW2 domain-containing protein, partial [Planctomycetota bacterium]